MTGADAGSQWSSLMSTPAASSFAALATTDLYSDNEGRPFRTVQSQRQERASAKRQREQSNVPVVQQLSRHPEREPNHGPVVHQASKVNKSPAGRLMFCCLFGRGKRL